MQIKASTQVRIDVNNSTLLLRELFDRQKMAELIEITAHS